MKEKDTLNKEKEIIPENEEKPSKKKKNPPIWGMFAAGFLWGITFAFIMGVLFLRYSLICEVRSTESYDDTVKKLAAKINATPGWQVKKSACAFPKPADGTKATSLKLCNINYALPLINDENSRKTAALMPCSFAIYQKSDGKTYVSYLNLKLFGLLVGGKTGKTLTMKVAPDRKLMLGSISKGK